MFELDWGKLVVIGIVALIVIGPKELPTVLRTVGQWVTKIRRMASEFQGQFQEAMREAEIADLKKQVDSMGDLSHDYTASSSADTAEHVPAPDHASSDHVPAPGHASSADHGHSAPDGAVGTTSDETTPPAHSPVPAEPHAAPEQHATPDPHPIAAAQQHGGVTEPASDAQATAPHKAGGQAA